MVFFTGCTSPVYKNDRLTGDATLRPINKGVGGMVSGEPIITVQEIDGVRTKMRYRDQAVYSLRPGKHELLVKVATITFKEAEQYMGVELTADRKYRLSAVFKDKDFTIELADETNAAAVTVVATTKLRSSRSDIMFIPVPIPVK